MTHEKLKFYISNQRFNVYLSQTNNDFSKSYQLYQANIELSEAFYPILSILEISLRNAINESLKVYFKDDYWFNNNLPKEFQIYISEATQKLSRQKKIITADCIIAELNFGFWNRLFNKNYTELLWKPLRLIFKNIPKPLRQRNTIEDSLFRIRTLRNRIYHYEPIFRKLDDLKKNYSDMLIFLTWLDKDLPLLIKDIDRFTQILEKTKSIEF